MRSLACILATIRANGLDSDLFEVEAEDELPFVQLGHWIGLAGMHSNITAVSAWVVA
jgi:hypothetical protein